MAWFEPHAPLLPEIMDLHGRWLADKTAVIGAERTHTWKTFSCAQRKIAAGLRVAGIGPGQRVAVLMSNSVTTAEILFGIVRAGCVVVPINTMVPTASVEAMLADSEAAALFCSPDQQIRWATPPLERCFGDGATGWMDIAAWRDQQDRNLPLPDLDDRAECNIIYSSGTTGVPKGIVHTHRARLDWFYDLALALRYDSGSVTLCTLGLYSNISWAAMGATLLAGGTLVIEAGFDSGRFLESVPRHGCTHTAMVPVQYQRILNDSTFDDVDLGTLRTIMCCGSPLDAATKGEVIRRFGCDLVELYGLTEGLITTLSPEDALTHLASVGKPLPGTDLRIIDDAGSEVAPGVAGEIVGRGRILMAGYNNRIEANMAATWDDPDGKRWLRTGDIGSIDDAGFLYLLDRKKDLIISGGQNIYPADIEQVMLTHPQVTAVAVVAVPCPRWGETPLAVVVGRGTIAPEALRAWVNARVGKQQRVSAVVVLEDLPRNANGKILKRELRSTYAGIMTNGETP